jgi:hypothetical protein
MYPPAVIESGPSWRSAALSPWTRRMNRARSSSALAIRFHWALTRLQCLGMFSGLLSWICDSMIWSSFVRVS